MLKDKFIKWGSENKKKSAWILHTYDKCFLIFCIKKSRFLNYQQFILIVFLNVYYIIVFFDCLNISC